MALPAAEAIFAQAAGCVAFADAAIGVELAQTAAGEEIGVVVILAQASFSVDAPLAFLCGHVAQAVTG